MPSGEASSLDPCRLLTHDEIAVSGTVARMQDLQPQTKWTSLLYAPKAYADLLTHPLMTPLASLAQARIGLQSFAKMFYIVPRDTQQRWGLEQRWLLPMALSPKDFDAPLLAPDTDVRYYVVACRREKSQLRGTQTLNYIEHWERQVLNPRGLARPVIGVQNLPRVRKTRRDPWYNLVDDLTRRGTAPVLLPRRIYQRYRVVWNQAGWVAGENFIEVQPQPHVPLEPLLAVLNAGVSEMALRVSAHVYGGGVYNLSPGSVGEVPVIDVPRLSAGQQAQLTAAYRVFLQSKGKDRGALDAVVLDVLELPTTFAASLENALDRMQHLSDAVLEPIAMDADEGNTWPEELRLL
jgi:hypothetical protein